MMEKEVWSLIWKATNLAILFALLYRLLASRIKAFFENRRISIEKTITEAERTKKEAEEKYGELKEKLQNADKETEKIIELFRKEGLAEKERIIKNAEKEAEKIKKQTAQTIQQEEVRAKATIRKDFAETVIRTATDLINRKQNDKDNERIIEEYIEKVVALH